MSDALLTVDELTVWRGEMPLLNRLSFSVDAGDVIHVVGTNGSGKTTLLRAICGLGMPDEGTVRWCGKRLPGARDAFQAALIYLGHRPGVSGALSARENLRYQMALHPDAGRWQDALAVATLTALGLGDRIDLPCRWLSAGQQRRVALARLVLQPARLWVLDEPMTALDSAGRHWVEQQLETHTGAGGAVILTSHQALESPQLTVRTLTLGAA